jgi:hypothetical protein
MRAVVNKVCSQLVRDAFPVIHELFCDGECGRPMRDQFKNAEDYWQAMGKYLKSRKKPRR